MGHALKGCSPGLQSSRDRWGWRWEQNRRPIRNTMGSLWEVEVEEIENGQNSKGWANSRAGEIGKASCGTGEPPLPPSEPGKGYIWKILGSCQQASRWDF